MLQCEHNNCIATFQGENQEYVKRRHVLSAYHDCDNGECLGCILKKKDHILTLFKTILEEANTIGDVIEIEKRTNNLMFPEEHPAERNNQKLYIRATDFEQTCGRTVAELKAKAYIIADFINGGCVIENEVMNDENEPPNKYAKHCRHCREPTLKHVCFVRIKQIWEEKSEQLKQKLFYI